MKLLYLADRESLQLHGMSMSGDHVVAMPHGPVLSQTLDLMNGFSASKPAGWDEWITDREDHEVQVAQGAQERIKNRDELDELSDADIDILKRTWKTFGAMGKWELSQYTHDECSEWKDPQGSSRPISYKDIFVAMGRSDEEAELLQNQIDEQCAIDELFKKI
jgi:uncharacterized phage-associated protein